MAQLTADQVRKPEFGIFGDLPVKASSTIYQGSAVGLTSGYARQFTAGDLFVGFATARAVGTSVDGGVNVNIQREGYIEIPVTSVAVGDVGKAVFATDGNTFVLTQSTNVRIGTVARYVSSGVAVVKFDAQRTFGANGLTALTDNSGGTASTTIAAIGGTYSQTEVRNAIASLAAQINNIRQYIA